MSSCEIRKLSMILLMLTNFLMLVSAQLQNNPNYSCTSNGNYSSNSTYSTNLNALLNSLSLNISDNGYYTSSVGQNEDKANALALCRADRTLDQCRSCVRSAARDIVQLCPNHRQGVIWSEFCMLRYSNDPIHRTQTNDPGLILRNALNVSNANEFREDRARLLEDLRVQAAHGSSELKVGAGSRNTSDSESQTIYGLVQCTPDLSSEECGGCLTSVAEPMRSCCDISRGVRMLAPSCHIQYELYSFYNETRLKELRVLPPLPPSPPGTDNDNSRSRKKDDNTREIVIIIFVPAAVSLILAAFAAILLRKRMKPRPQEFPGTTYEISMVESLQYDFGQIRAATNDFADANKLGRGGFGAVYKGQLLNGTEIAVKRLAKDSKQGNMEFKNEVLLVAKLQHRNLVRLLGFSIEGTERILIYEFMQNASLDQFIFDSTKRSHLNWDRRYKIIGSIARGLLYLHEDSRFRIIHRDLKVSNILLDGDMNPKIADFGMARLFGQDETQGNTCRIVGTFGYMSPEYAMHGRFSVKSDVFSFGVLILEILSGRRNNCIRNEENMEDLLSFTWKNWQEGTAVNMIDPVVLRNGTRSMHEMLRCIHIGLLCVQQNVAKRPTMTLVVLMLSSSTMMLPVPSEPGFYAASRFGPDVSPFQEYDSIGSNSNRALNVKIGKCEGSSQNDMSVTELYPR